MYVHFPLLKLAFEKANFNTFKTQPSFVELYPNETPYYGDDAPGTAPTEQFIFSIGDINKIERFNQQFSILINKIKKLKQLKFTREQIKNLHKFNTRITKRNYYVNQSAQFYAEIKFYFEHILCVLSTDNNNRYHKPIMHDLVNNISVCGPGVFTHIKNAYQLLNGENNIEIWLASLRKLLIQQLADLHIRNKKIRVGDSIHVHNAFFSYACKQNWNPLGCETDHSMIEIHENLAKITPRDYGLFTHEFLNRYTASSIMTCISERLFDRYAERINLKKKENRKGIVVNNFEEFINIFSDLPLIDKPGILNLLFKFTEKERVSNSKDYLFRFGSLTCQLKPQAELKLALTQYFIKTNFDLFKGHNIALSNTLSYGIVPGSPDICYVADEDTITALGHSKALVDLNLLKKNKIPLSQLAFDSYYELGIRDFSDCILENIDMRELSDFKLLNFSRAIFKNVQIMPSQIACLAVSHYNAFESDFDIDIDFKLLNAFKQKYNFYTAKKLILAEKNVDTINYAQLPDKNTCLHWAARHNQPELIELVIAAGGDDRALNIANLTPMQVAQRNNNTHAVDAFANITADWDNKHKYSESLRQEVIDKPKKNCFSRIKSLFFSTRRPSIHKAIDFAMRQALNNNWNDLITIIEAQTSRLPEENRSRTNGIVAVILQVVANYQQIMKADKTNYDVVEILELLKNYILDQNTKTLLSNLDQKSAAISRNMFGTSSLKQNLKKQILNITETLSTHQKCFYPRY